jgi:hypothetical protein
MNRKGVCHYVGDLVVFDIATAFPLADVDIQLFHWSRGTSSPFDFSHSDTHTHTHTHKHKQLMKYFRF